MNIIIPKLIIMTLCLNSITKKYLVEFAKLRFNQVNLVQKTLHSIIKIISKPNSIRSKMLLENQTINT